MKKLLTSIVVIVLVLTACLTVLAACVDPVDYEHTIVFYSSQGDALVQKTANAIAAFEAKYPGWKVNHQTQGGYDDVKDKIISDFQGKKQPDLAYCYPDHVAQYIETSQVVNINEYIERTDTIATMFATGEVDADGNAIMESKDVVIGYSGDEVNDIIEGYFNEGLASNFTGAHEYGYDDDALLALPFVKSTEVLYCNWTALKQAGITKIATTWDELWQQCAQIKKRFPTSTPLGYDSEANWFITMCEQNGWGYTSVDENNHFLFDNPQTTAWLTKLHEYYEEGYIATQQEYDAYTSALFTSGAETGCIYCVGSSGGASHQSPNGAFEWRVAPIPGSVIEKNADGTPKTVNYSAISQGPSLVMLSGGNGVSNVKEKELMTWLFVKELLDPTFQASFAEAAGYNPSRLAAYEDEQYAEFLEGDTIVAATANVARSMTDRYFTSPAFSTSSLARTQVGTALLAALTGQKDPARALSDAFTNCGGKK